ncbi:hypothetical protein J4460_01450 [Candidatus Woesearchaeota archaeon]|nr:hypothetical protein [Candidatus Woesearchaeota archaeon]HIH38619.1 hypothetical protein [Candidatus Woesearchaeota archaeon]HIH49442.1 hypothetical protein [Candidatus Woesearchaeota archaeon]HIJ02823.1 hypothetical protein [Candidatus Woesearchaeota archaeon]
MEPIIITKRVAKHGRQAVIVIPKLLEKELSPGTVVQLSMRIVKEAEDGAN